MSPQRDRLLRAASLTAMGVLLLLLGRVASAAEAGQSVQKEWEKVLSAAAVEGQVNIAGPPGDAFREAIVDAFRKVTRKSKSSFWAVAAGIKSLGFSASGKRGSMVGTFTFPDRHPRWRRSSPSMALIRLSR